MLHRFACHAYIGGMLVFSVTSKDLFNNLSRIGPRLSYYPPLHSSVFKSTISNTELNQMLAVEANPILLQT